MNKRYFLISFFSPINFTYCKVNNYVFNYQTAIVKLTEKSHFMGSADKLLLLLNISFQ